MTKVPSDVCPQCGSTHVLRNLRRTIECHDCNHWTKTNGKTGKMDPNFDFEEPDDFRKVPND